MAVRMKPPMCKLCEKAHWLDDAHDTSALEEVRALGASVLRKPVAVKQTVKHFDVKQGDVVQQMGGITVAQVCECGNEIKGRGKKCPACYQRAYRERSK